MTGVSIDYEETAELILELLKYQRAKVLAATDQIMTDLDVGTLERGEYEIRECFHPIARGEEKGANATSKG